MFTVGKRDPSFYNHVCRDSKLRILKMLPLQPPCYCKYNRYIEICEACFECDLGIR